MSRLFIVLGIIGGLIVAGFVALLVLLDNPDAYKKELSETFEAGTGYGLQINGSLDWQYFPPVAIGMSDVAITIPNVDIPLATLDSASVDLKVLPLIFGGSVEISGLDIDGLTVNATVDSRGRGNWEVEGSSEAAPATDEGSDSSENSGNDLQVDIGGISITNTTINYADLSSDSDYLIELNSLKTGPLGTGVVTDISSELRILDKIANSEINTSIQGKAAINESLDEFLLDGLVITTNMKQPDAADLDVELTLNGKVNTSSETAALNNSTIQLAGLTLSLDVDMTDIFGKANLDGKISAPAFDARTVLAAVDADPGPMANPNALSKVTIDGDIGGDMENIALTNFNLGLDQSALTGTMQIGLANTTSLGFNLSIDSINASDYLSPTTEGSDSANTTAATEEDSEVIPVETLSTTNINGKFSIKALQYDGWEMRDLNLEVKNRSSILSIVGAASAYAGNFKLSVVSRYPNNKVSTTSKFEISGVNIANALETASLTGTIELDSSHNFTGSMMSELADTLKGKATFNIADGTLDVRPIKQLAAIVDSVQGSESGIGEWPDVMPFNSLNGDHNITAGLAKDQSFTANLENMRLGGTGGMDYFANTVDFRIHAVLLENVGGQFTVNSRLTNVRWPLHCEGRLDADPMTLCLPDKTAVTQLLKDIATQELKRKGKEALQEKLKDKLPDSAKDLFKGLFGN